MTGLSALSKTAVYTKKGISGQHMMSSAEGHKGRYSLSAVCVLDCLSSEECHGAEYNSLTQQCAHKTCLNPDILPDYNGESFYVYVKNRLQDLLNPLLALGIEYHKTE